MKAMQLAPSGGQIFNLCKWHHLVAKFATYASGAIWWPNLQIMQVAPSGGQICNLCKLHHLVPKFATYASGTIWWPKLQVMQLWCHLKAQRSRIHGDRFSTDNVCIFSLVFLYFGSRLLIAPRVWSGAQTFHLASKLQNCARFIIVLDPVLAFLSCPYV